MSNYKEGEAVISPNQENLIIKVGSGWESLDGTTYLMIGAQPKRPATEAEILAEIAKHGWGERQENCLESPLDYFELTKTDKWEWVSYPPILQSNLKEYCEEGLQAHRIITALNLVK